MTTFGVRDRVRDRSQVVTWCAKCPEVRKVTAPERTIAIRVREKIAEWILN